MDGDFSAYGLSLKLGDVYFGDSDHNVLVLGRDDPGWPGLSRTVYEIPFADGSIAEGGVLRPVSWTVQCRIHASTKAACLARLESVLHALYSDEDQRLIFDSQPDRYYLVSASEPGPARFDALSECVSFEITFSLSDPTGYALLETEQVVEISANPQSFSVLAGALEKGSIPPWPTWIVEAGGAADGFTITNNTTGQAFSDSTNLESGDFVKLDAQLQEKFTSSNGITYTRDNSGGSGTVPRLKPRTTNSITVTGLSAATITLRYRERFAAIAR